MKKKMEGKMVFKVLISSITLILIIIFSYECRAEELERHFGVQGGLPYFVYEMKEAGVGVSRDWINWEEIEPVEDQYNWIEMDKKVQAANQANIEILGYFVRMPSWAMKEKASLEADKLAGGKKFKKKPLGDKKKQVSEFYEPKDINDFREFVRDVAMRYDGKHGHGIIKYFEILNEVTLPEYFDIKNTDYEPWLINGYKAVKEANPEAKVLIGGFINPLDAREFVDRMLRDYNNYYDIISFHVYKTDSLVSEATSYLKSRMKLFGVNKPFWLTETSTVLSAVGSGEFQGDIVAKDVIKRFARAFGEGVERVFWFTLVGMPTVQEHELGDKRKTVGLGWSLKNERVFHPRQAYYTYRLMSSKLMGFSSVDKIGDAQYKFNFRDKKPVYVLWCSSASCPLPSELSGIFKVTDYLGNEQIKIASEIILTNSPIFVEKQKGDVP